ncbi:MAG TPA: ketoacyl-ACP synthase III [Candidatus Limnocylindria bacterium]|jgi:3-oxoacyl-[acyl-carrier-protein] synthase-3
MRVAAIQALQHHLPERRVTNEELAALYPGWTAEKIFEKTGIRERRVVSAGEHASDLAVAAAEKVLDRTGFDRQKVDLLLYCTQSPDYFLPTTACILQDRLRLPITAAAFDYNLGCSAFPYGLAMARGLIETGAATNALLVMGETYSRFMHERDKSVRTLFGDAGSATLITATDREGPTLGPFVFGTDGSGAGNLIVRRGALREPLGDEALPEKTDESGNVRTDANLYMNGPAILEFTIRRIPAVVTEIFRRAEITMNDVRWVVLHQANEYMLRFLQKRIGIPDAKFAMHFAHCGNTVSSTIPIVMEHLVEERSVDRGDLVLAVGFGVGYSWGASLIRWSPDA